MTESSMDTWSRGEAADVARAMLEGDIALLDGCIPLAFLAHSAVLEWSTDPDFAVIGTLAAEIEELPLGAARSQWSRDALGRADLEIARISERSKDSVLAACRNIVARFSVAGEPAA